MNTYQTNTVDFIVGDAAAILDNYPSGSFHCCVTSPPYFGLRDYGVEGQIGLEQTPAEYVDRLVQTFREVRRTLRDDGVLFLNLGDSYFGGGRGGNPPGSPHQKQKTNRGSVSMPASARRATSYDTRGKAPVNFQASDCLCGSLCDACRTAYRLGISRSGIQRAPTPELSTDESIREHTVSPFDRAPMSGSTRPVDRIEVATPYREPSVRRGVAPLHGAPASTTTVSSPQRQEERRQSGQPSECLSCGCSLPDCVLAFARKAGCTCDTVSLGSASDNLGTDTSGSAYPHLTTESLKPKDLIGIPWRVAFALQADGWYLRSDIIWHKPNPMPESVTDRPTCAHEHIFLLSKSERYFYDAKAILEPATFAGPNGAQQSPYAQGFKRRTPEQEKERQAKALRGVPPRHAHYASSTRASLDDVPRGLTRNARNVWTVATRPFKGAHFATFPPALIEPCILAGCPVNGLVLDPFGGSGTTGLVAKRNHRNALLIDINPANEAIAAARLASNT